VAAGLRLGGKPGRALKEAYENLHLAVGEAYAAGGGDGDRSMLDGILAAGLTPTVETDYERWRPLHWILAVPDVMERGGFHAVIGNPPFLGGSDITGSVGKNLRDWLVQLLAGGRRGNADIVAYFFLRALRLLDSGGKLGLIATNTVAQGDTREVGLDQMVEQRFAITRSIQSRAWPAASANVVFAAVWGTRGDVADSIPRVSDEIAVDSSISTLLEPAGRSSGPPIRLVPNHQIAFSGCKVYGSGFMLDEEEAIQWIEGNESYGRVLFPCLNGDDLNSRPDSSASQWVIDFGDRSESGAKEFELAYRRVFDQVRPVRLKNKRKSRRDRWWQFAEIAPTMRKEVESLSEVLVIALTSKTVMPVRTRTGQVFSHALGVFALDSYAEQAILSSGLHQTWAIKYGSGMRNDPRYTPSDVFDTFPRPEPTDRLVDVGKTLDTERRDMMLRRNLGLTKLYNLVNAPDITDSADPDVARIRRIHVELDEAVMSAYGWDDVPLDHGFHTYRQMRRWTVSPTARVEILDRLLEENHRRARAQGEAPPPAEEIEGYDQ
jgi:hypothetical protein